MQTKNKQKIHKTTLSTVLASFMSNIVKMMMIMMKTTVCSSLIYQNSSSTKILQI